MSQHILILPRDFENYEWEVQTKGWFGGAIIRASGKEYGLMFYDPVRLLQEIESEHRRRVVFFEKNLLVITSVTKAMMELAVEDMVKSRRIDFLIPN